MPGKTKLRQELEARGIRDVSLCLYPLKAAEAASTRDIFHYHIEKCGGMAVSSALLGAAHIDRLINRRNRIFARATSSTAEALHNRNDKTAQAFVSYVGEFNGPRFGSHLLLGDTALTFAFFRNPFDRLVSHFYYDCRRGNITAPPGPDSFAAYIRSPENICFQTQMMASSPYDGGNEAALLDEALSNTGKLDIAELHHRMEQALLEIWTVFDLPGIVAERLHSNAAKPYDFEAFRDEIEKRNWADYRLVDFVTAEPRHLMQFTEHDLNCMMLPQYFGVVSDTQSDEGALMVGKVCRSETLVRAIAEPDTHSVADIFRRAD
ncbi:MAG: sulfotransferase family 2 domain-containing protein [Alphaproteobacteria bacterium]